MNFKQNHFELFGLPQRFDVDLSGLDVRYRELQREVHPDRFASAPQAEQRLSIQLATQVNEAYRTLKSPLARALYLLQLHGVDPQLETDTAMPPDFLAEQMELREVLAEAVEAENGMQLSALAARLRRDREAVLAEIEAQLQAHAWSEAAGTLRRLMFLEKLGEEIRDAEEDM